ncbi:mitochondrial solute carrier family 25 member 38 [Andalucia godoyi]|uniref:Mitochondrial solute carrier family 25 member 38 n=1 Tax=Andalucia godoyi TaxID=505711 RepID=A0A8K0AH13_ANDGO|nr:mitochondrial solute carrier family 25 member 38 [Andalucia godoyi]|eukprot:ANDGO_06625.mRNA.1 mitochondrial solute carrier family 25 member 38
MSDSSPGKNLLSGSLAATTTALCLQPFDVIKTIMIGAPSFSKTSQSVMSSRARIAQQMTFREASKWIVQTEGYAALWKGSVPSLLRVAPGSGMYFMTISIVSKAFHEYKARKLARINRQSPDGVQLSVFEMALVGFSSRAMVAVLSNPISVVKTRLEYQSGKKVYSGTVDAFVKICRSESPRAFFSGLVPTIARDAPFSGIYLASYKTVKGKLEAYSFAFPSVMQHNSVYAALSGTCAGIVATLVTHPADVIKTRVQLSYATGHMQKNPLSWAKHFAQIVSSILAEHGWRGFMRGALPRVLKRSMSAAFTWTIYEYLMQVIIR